MRRLKPGSYMPVKLGVPPIRYDVFEGVCRPLAEWYTYMSENEKKNIPQRVMNALDSLSQMVRRK